MYNGCCFIWSWLSGVCHYDQEWNHANSSAYETLPVNRAKDLSHEWGSYLHIDDNKLCFANKDSYDDDDIVEELSV